MLFTLFCSLSTSSCIRSWFFWSSSWEKVNSFTRRSVLLWDFWASTRRLCSSSSCPSRSLIFCSSLETTFLPPFTANCSASSSLVCMSFTWLSSTRLFLSAIWAFSCSARSSSAILAASIIAFLAFSSAILLSVNISSRSACMVCISESSFLLLDWRDWFWRVQSATCSITSLSSCSAVLRCLSACSSWVLVSSSSFLTAWAFLSLWISCSLALSLYCCSVSSSCWASLICPWYFLIVCWASALAPLACSRAMSSSLRSASSFFLWRKDSFLALDSLSSEACMDSMALW